MSYLSVKDELVSLNLFSSPEGFENGILRFWTEKYMVWGSIHLLPVFSKKIKFFGNFNCDFRNFSPKGFF